MNIAENQIPAVSLADLTIGAYCHVAAIELQGLLRRRILDLGLVPGTPVTCIRKSPAGNPIAFAVRGTTIAIRSEDAQYIKVYPAATKGAV